MYTLGRWRRDLLGLVGMAVVALAFFTEYHTLDTREHNIGDVFFVGALLVPPYVFGRVVQRLAAQKELLEEREELVTREAVRAERDRIARELHDVIAHSVSAMVVQTAAAQDLVRTDPDRAERVLRDVAETGRRALVETGRLLHVIRDDSDELGLDPAPGVADLERLVRGVPVRGTRGRPVGGRDGWPPCPRASTSRRTGSRRRPSPTRCGTAAVPPPCRSPASGDAVAIRATNPTGPPRPRWGPVSGCAGWRSGSPCWAARSATAAPTATSSSPRPSRWGTP